jgi:preprotein translocase subunit YajC
MYRVIPCRTVAYRAAPPCNAQVQRIGSRQIHSALTKRRCLDKRNTPLDMNQIGQFLPLILIFAIMYFLLIRPQQKKMKEHTQMVANVRRGDQVVTQGGLIGKIAKVKDDNEVEVELAEGVKVRVVKSTIAQVLSKTEPAA